MQPATPNPAPEPQPEALVQPAAPPEPVQPAMATMMPATTAIPEMVTGVATTMDASVVAGIPQLLQPAVQPPYACMGVTPQVGADGGNASNRWVPNVDDVKLLDQIFDTTPFPNRDVRMQLASQLQVRPRQVQVWFQNKRQRVKSRGEPVPPRMPGVLNIVPTQQHDLDAASAVAVAAAAAEAAQAAAEAAQAAAAAAMANCSPVVVAPASEDPPVA